MWIHKLTWHILGKVQAEIMSRSHKRDDLFGFTRTAHKSHLSGGAWTKLNKWKPENDQNEDVRRFEWTLKSFKKCKSPWFAAIKQAISCELMQVERGGLAQRNWAGRAPWAPPKYKIHGDGQPQKSHLLPTVIPTKYLLAFQIYFLNCTNPLGIPRLNCI